MENCPLKALPITGDTYSAIAQLPPDPLMGVASKPVDSAKLLSFVVIGLRYRDRPTLTRPALDGSVGWIGWMDRLDGSAALNRARKFTASQHGVPTAYLVDVDTYDKLQKRIGLLEGPPITMCSPFKPHSVVAFDT